MLMAIMGNTFFCGLFCVFGNCKTYRVRVKQPQSIGEDN